MKEIKLLSLGLVVGLFMGWFICWTTMLVETQTTWQEGRQSVLNTTVQVGGEDTPCSVKIPLSVLSEMVVAGVMDWHTICKGELK